MRLFLVTSTWTTPGSNECLNSILISETPQEALVSHISTGCKNWPGWPHNSSLELVTELTGVARQFASDYPQ